MQEPNTMMKAVLDKFGELNTIPVEELSAGNARNLPTLKSAVESMAADNALVRTMNVAMPVMPEPVGDVTHIRIPSQGGELIARVFKPKSDGHTLHPVLVYFHGGGWVIANLDVYEPSCRALCNAADCIVMSVAYRQAPENPYPAAVEDAYAAVQWALLHADQIGGDVTRVAVGGESAGGNLATVSCLKARDEGGHMPVAQLLIYPVTQYNSNTPSMSENANAKPLNAKMMPWFWSYYLPNEAAGQDPYVSPMLADVSGLPPALIITAEIDPLRDEGEAYADKLAAAGVSARSIRHDSVTHEFFGLAGAVPEAKKAVGEAADFLKDAWGKGPQM